jgi:conjugal transfer/type IV secretion protein DotA/TraY
MTVSTNNTDQNNIGGNTPSTVPTPTPSKKRQFFSYIFMPGIMPQIKELGRGSFGYLAFLIALVYQAVRILPNTHPYTQYENLGSFGIRQVIAEAAHNIKLSKENIDQIIVFFAVIAGLIIMALQVIGFVLLLVTGNAWAQDITPDSFGGIFHTQNPDTDIAFHMMREVFGVPNMFGALEGADAAAGVDGRTNLHKALHAMFQFYNLAILVVAIIVFIYYIIVVVGETAQSGTPFGQRFNHIYAPLRLVVAIGLLVPLNYGFNGAQYLTFFAAKMGSGFATTGWTEFNRALVDSNPLGADNATLIAPTKAPDIESLVEFMAVAVTCREAYKVKNDRIIEAMVEINQNGIANLPLTENTMKTLAEMEKYNKDIRIFFGHPDRDDDTEIPEAVRYKSKCGSIIIPFNLAMSGTETEFDPAFLQKRHFQEIIALWNNTTLKEIGEKYANHYNNCYTIDCGGGLPSSDKKEAVLSVTRFNVNEYIKENYNAARENLDLKIQQETLKRGWGGAGIWYNRIAQINGAYVIAVRNIPQPQKFPEIMEKVVKEKQKNDTKLSGCKTFEPNISGDKSIKLPLGSSDYYYASTLDAAYQYWTCDKATNSSNFFLDAASAVFGLNGLLTIRDNIENEDGTTTEIHPLAKLSALGKGLIESAIRNMSLGIASSLGSGFASAVGATQVGGALGALSSMFVSIATIGLSIGFITYYILPFLPFIYFFFALGNWVKSIFEAMVGAPLWALAHLRIDGDGLPGKMAMNGYLLIFEIFLRPILTVFGLLGGMAVFTALAAITNEIFDIVVSVGIGVDLAEEADSIISMHIVDVFFFTTVYAIILYMMAVSSFKMINLVPNNILRWLGHSVAAFSDNAPDPTQGMTQYAAIGGARIGGQLAGGITQGAQGVGSAIGTPFGIASAGN